MGFVYLLVSLYTLSSNPLPWYDETYMASLSKSFLEKGELIKQVAYYTDNPKVDLRFGPVYFLFTSLSFKLFGIGIFQFRIVAYLSGLLAMVFTVKIFRIYSQSIFLSCLLGLLLIYDPFYFRSMREGRMDLMALSFILAAVFFLLKKQQSSKKTIVIKNVFISGIMAALAILTTPRAGFLYIGLGCIWTYLLILSFKEVILQILIWIIPIILLYSVWIIYAYGGFEEFYLFYRDLSVKYTQSGNFYITIQKNQYILIPLSSLSIVIGLIKYKVAYFTPFIICNFVSIISFYLIVQDPGPYSVFILPYYYLLIFLLAAKEKMNNENVENQCH